MAQKGNRPDPFLAAAINVWCGAHLSAVNPESQGLVRHGYALWRGLCRYTSVQDHPGASWDRAEVSGVLLGISSSR